MIKMGGRLDGEYILNDYAETVEEAIKVKDYYLWYHNKFKAELTYKGQLLNRLDDDCEFDEEIEYLKNQIMVIDNIRKEEV